MKKLLSVLMMAMIILFCITGIATATVLTFDDIPGHQKIPDGYGGLNWSEWFWVGSQTLQAQTDPHSGYVNGTVTPDHFAFNAYANPISVSGNLFNFQGAYLTAAWNTGLNIDVSGYKNGILLYDRLVVVNTNSPTWVDFNFSGIDELGFISYGGVNAGLALGGTHFVMDNFTYNTAVPEPSTMLLLGLGLVGLAGVRRTFKNTILE